jgi:hypothetical protein
VFNLRLRVPSKNLREKFLITYELEGCQEAVNFLAKHYGIKKMKIVLDDKKVGKGNDAIYLKNKAYFSRKGLNKRIVLHEFYHHLVFAKGLELSNAIEEQNAQAYPRDFLRCGL